MEEKEVGVVAHYFGKVGVGMVRLTDTLKIGDTIHVKGHSGDFTQQVSSMQMDYKAIQEAGTGHEVAIKMEQKVHQNDKVYKTVP